MDQKQKNLSPELKAVYDRVMNTKVSSRPSAPAIQTANVKQQPTQNTAPSVSTNNQPILRTEVLPSIPISTQQTPYATQPTSAPTEQEMPLQPPVVEPPRSTSDLSPIEPAEAQPGTFLSSLPPRPLNVISSEPFVFTGGKTNTQSSSDKTTQDSKPGEQPEPTSAGNKLSSKIIIGLLVIFLVVYSVFWAKIFNIF